MTQTQHEEIEQLEELAAIYRSRLRVLNRQIAAFGLHVPAHITLDREQAAQGLAKAQAELHRLGRGIPTEQPPYLGLSTFQERHADLFFGREQLVTDLVARVERSAFLIVLGASGSGKSSVVRAGLLPELKGGALPGSERWRYATIRPDTHPLDSLAAALAKLQGGDVGSAVALSRQLAESDRALLLAARMLMDEQDDGRLVLVVDQAEELWTLAPTDPLKHDEFLEQEQRPFIRLLLTTAEESERAGSRRPILVILTMRADFLHRAAENAELARWIGEHDVIVSAMTGDELREAIVRPAETAGCRFEPGLVDELIEQVQGRPGALPLLEYTLLDLWKARDPDGTLTWQAFKDLGGVEGALAARADAILKERYPAPEQQDQIRRVLLRLVQPGEGSGDTRRRARLQDLVPIGQDEDALRAIIQPLADERLLTTGHDTVAGDETVEITHEALIRAWPTFASWIDAARTDLRLQLQLEDAAKEWVASGEQPEYLWSGLRLANAESWQPRAQPQLNTGEHAFLKASVSAHVAAQHSARRRVRWTIGGLAGALVVISVLAGVALWSSERAQQSALHDRARLLVERGRNVSEQQPLLALRLELEGLALLPAADQETRAEVVQAITDLAGRGRLSRLRTDSVAIYGSPRGDVFILDRSGAKAELRRTSDGALLSELTGSIRHPEDPNQVTFSSDGNAFVVKYRDAPGELRRTDTGKAIATFANEGFNVTFSPDGKILIIQYGAAPGEIRQTDNGTLIATLDTIAPFGVAFSADGTTFTIGYKDGKPSELRRTSTGEVVAILLDFVPVSGSATDSFDRRIVVINPRSAPGELLRRDTGARIRLTGQLTPAGATFSPDSTRVLVRYANSPAELRRTDTGAVVATFAPKASRGIFSEDGATFMVQYGFGPGELRRSDTGALIAKLADSACRATFSPNSIAVVIHTCDYSVLSELHHVNTGALATRLESPVGVRFSPNGATFVALYPDKPGELRQTTTGAVLATLTGQINNFDSISLSQIVTFSPDGHAVAVRYDSAPADVWDIQGMPRRLTQLGIGAAEALFEPTSRRLIVRYSQGAVDLLDLDWLRSMRGDPAYMPVPDLVRLACDGPLASSLWSDTDQRALVAALDGRAPEACQRMR